MLTFAAAAGSLLMKATAAPVIRAFGFRFVLIVNALISVVFMGANGLFTAAARPHVLIFGGASLRLVLPLVEEFAAVLPMR